MKGIILTFIFLLPLNAFAQQSPTAEVRGLQLTITDQLNALVAAHAQAAAALDRVAELEKQLDEAKKPQAETH